MAAHYCIECDDLHTTSLHCPKCGACGEDWSSPDSAHECWNCGFAVTL